MKNIALYVACLSTFMLVLPACVLDKEPGIPIGANNEIEPTFFSADVTPIAHDSIYARAWLHVYGNLNILEYGWVWSENPEPTITDNKVGFVNLPVSTDSFDTFIPGLIFGKTYHVRPYVATGLRETYGPEKTITMTIPRLSNTVVLADSACFLRVQSDIESSVQLLEYGIVYLKGTEGVPSLQNKDGKVQGYNFNNGRFQTDMSMLTPNTKYKLRAYAVTSSGTGYGNPITITTQINTASVAANFTINTDEEVFQGATILFTNSSSGANSYSWDFGDGQSSGEASPVHTFNTVGNVIVTLSAGNGGCIVTKKMTMRIIADPFEDYFKNIPGGTFRMGCTAEQSPFCDSDTEPDHQVTISPFLIGKTEITQGQWQAVMGNNPSNFYQCGLNCPVSNVVWERIVTEFIPALYRKTGRLHRLPTEAEWEYAARGGITDPFSMTAYAGSNTLDLVGWYGDEPHPVGQKQPNAFGLYDMSGNIEEWCHDWYDDEYYEISPFNDPTGPATGTRRVLRGGSYDSLEEEDCSVSTRNFDNPTSFAEDNEGFRLVRQ